MKWQISCTGFLKRKEHIYVYISSFLLHIFNYWNILDKSAVLGFSKSNQQGTSWVIKSNDLPHLMFGSGMLTVVFQINTILGIFHAVVSIFLLKMLLGSYLFINLWALCILYIGQAFHYSPENAFNIFKQQIYFTIWYLLDRASLLQII